MIITGWHIDGFGHFFDCAGPRLSAGVTVILGPNEAGKSTLHAFLRGVLFGFPSKNAKDEQHIPPLRGGSHGGRVFLEDGSGAKWTVERHKGKKPILHCPDGSIGGEAELVALLGHLDGASYRSVFGFDLADLGRLQALDEESVRDRLLSAWVTGAGDSVATTTRALDARIKEPLSGKGEFGTLLEAFKAAEKTLDEASALANAYAGRVEALEELSAHIAADQEKLRRTRANALRLGSFVRLKPLSIELEQAKAAIAALPSLPPMPQDAEESFVALSSAKRNASAELDRARGLVRECRAKLSAVAVDKALAELDEALAPALLTLEVHRERLERLETLKTRAIRARSELEAALSSLGRGWTAERIGSFGDQGARRAFASRHCAEFSRARSELEAARGQLARAEARAKSYGEAPQPLSESKTPSGLVPAALALGGAVFFLAGAFLDPGALKWGALVAALALTVGAAFKSASRGSAPEPANQALELARAQAAAELAEAKAEEGRCRARFEALEREWQSEVAKWPLPDETGPEAALELLDALAETARKKLEFDAVAAEEAQTSATVAEWEGRIASLLADRVPSAISSHPLVAALEHLAAKAKGEAASARLAEELSAKLRALEAEETERARAFASASGALDSFLERLGVADEEELRAAVRTAREGEAFKTRLTEASRQLEAHFGSDEAAREELSRGSVALWEGALAEDEKETALLEESLEYLNRSYGAESRALETLRDSEAIQEAEALLSALKAKAAEAAGRWRKAALARALLKDALDSYAAERQPGVLGIASSHFKSITEGKYSRIVQPPGETREVRVVRADGTLQDPAALSRGTREELYFAIRLGLAKDFTERGAHLPLLADDVFVNFDPDRASRAYAALAGLAAGSQVIIFTCHPDTARRIAAVAPGANVVDL